MILLLLACGTASEGSPIGLVGPPVRFDSHLSPDLVVPPDLSFPNDGSRPPHGTSAIVFDDPDRGIGVQPVFWSADRADGQDWEWGRPLELAAVGLNVRQNDQHGVVTWKVTDASDTRDHVGLEIVVTWSHWNGDDQWIVVGDVDSRTLKFTETPFR